MPRLLNFKSMRTSAPSPLATLSALRERSGWRRYRLMVFVGLAACFSSCSSTKPREIKVSVSDQKLALYEEGKLVRVYGCSTSKFGVGDRPGSYSTPLGRLVVAEKIGSGARPGTVFKGRQATREVIRPNTPGRDPIVTRILWLKGKEGRNCRAHSRCIYIHGTPEEMRIGSPASYGCIRMKSMDIIDLFRRVNVGTEVQVVKGGLPLGAKLKPAYAASFPAPPPLLPPVAPGTSRPAYAANQRLKMGPEVASSTRKNSVR